MTKLHLRSAAGSGRVLPAIGTILVASATLPMIAPFLWMLTTSLKSGAHAFDLPPNWLPREWRVQNFLTLFQSNVPFAIFLWNSVEIAAAVTMAQLFTCSMAGYAFAQLRFRGKKGLFVMLLASLMMPIQVTIVPLFLMMSALGLVDTHWAIILPLATNAFGMFLMRQFFLTLPRELIEAARIDGASQFTTFWRIALPLAKPSLAALGIITFVNTWNNYFLPLVFLNSWEKMTLPLGMFALSNVYGSGNVSVIMAAVCLAVFPLLVLFLAAQRYIISGMIGSAIKG
ncbi:MAG: sugar ABC transporter permease [Acidobacteria bacterium]|nr:MAG: sugar ABC transporter permease [Acidobacteriota bacterium]